MTNITKRLLSLAIAVIMMISLLPVSVFAETPANLPKAEVKKLPAMTLAADEYITWPSGDTSVERPLEIAVNFKALDTLEECLAGGYANWLVDFNLTFSNLANGTIVTDNCYLAGNYGDFNWVVINAEGLELEDGVTYPVVSAYDASLNYKDICKSVQNFTAAIHIDEAILNANPGMIIKLELVMTDPENSDNKQQVGEDLIYTVADLKGNVELTLPQAEVTPMSKVELAENEYRVWNGVVSNNESTSLVPGSGDMPLEVVLNFKALDTLEECLAGGYAKWLVDFNVTVDGLKESTVSADGCYLAGNYGSYGWIKIPLDGKTIENGVTYPVVANYDPTLNYKDICKSVKDFTAAIHVAQAILDANPDITVTLELVMTNPNDETDKLYVGEAYVYDAEALKNSIAAMNTETNVVYSTASKAVSAAKAGETVIMLTDFTDEDLVMKRDVTLDLNGYELHAADVINPYATSNIIDSTDGQALLVVEKEALAIHSANSYMPVWVEEENVSGYRFTKVSLRQSAKLQNNGSALFRFYIEGDDANCALQQALENGGADNYVAVRVQLKWTDINGNTATRTYEYADEKLALYAENWTGNEFRLTVTGMEHVTELNLTATIVSEATEVAKVTVNGDTKTITK